MATNNDYTGKKQLYTRQVQKHDTEQNWTTAGNNGFIPFQGEIIVYEGVPVRIKIGDGVTNINSLPFALSIYVQSTAPTNASVGSVWIDTSVSSVKSVEGVEF